MDYNRNINECIFILYNNLENKKLKEFSQILTNIHIENNFVFQFILKEISAMSKLTQEWPSYFRKLDGLVRDREEARKLYDHYEKKLHHMDKIFEHRDRKECLYKHQNFLNSLERNLKKYKLAKQNYFKKAKEAYAEIRNLLDNRFEVINPVVMMIFSIENKIFGSLYNQFKTYKNIDNYIIQENKNNSEQEFFKIYNNYNPIKYMKYPDIDKKYDNPNYYKRSKFHERKSVSLSPPRMLNTEMRTNRINNFKNRNISSQRLQRLPTRSLTYYLDEFEKMPNVFSEDKENGILAFPQEDESDQNCKINETDLSNYNQRIILSPKKNKNDNPYILNQEYENYNQTLNKKIVKLI
jgi:hypothetical protein